jgi:hypothetical protein
MEATSNNLFVIEFFQQMQEDYKKTKKVPVIYNKFTVIPFKTELLSDLVNVDFINKLYDFFIKINRLNQTMEDTNVFYEELKQKFFKEGKVEVYVYCFNELIDKINQLEKFLKEIEEDVIRHSACLAILIEKQKPFFVRVMNLVCFEHYPKDMDKLLNAKIAELKTVYSNRCEENKMRIDKIMKKAYTKDNADR